MIKKTTIKIIKTKKKKKKKKKKEREREVERGALAFKFIVIQNFFRGRVGNYGRDLKSDETIPCFRSREIGKTGIDFSFCMKSVRPVRDTVGQRGNTEETPKQGIA